MKKCVLMFSILLVTIIIASIVENKKMKEEKDTLLTDNKNIDSSLVISKTRDAYLLK